MTTLQEQSTPPTGSAEDTLLFKNKHPIRYVMLGSPAVPYFSLDDICATLNRSNHAAAQVDSPSFPAHAKRTCWEETDEGLQDTTVLSPVGVWLLTEAADPAGGQAIAAWARREAKRLCPDPTPGDPAMFLTLTPDGKLPPRPMKYSGRKTEWLDLRDSLIGPGAPMPSNARRELQATLLAAAEASRLAAEATQCRGTNNAPV